MDLVVVQIPCELEQFRRFVCFLSRGVLDCLTLLLSLWFVLLCYLPWRHGDQGMFADVWRYVEDPFTQALFHELPYGHLGQHSRIYLFHLLQLRLPSLNQSCLQAGFNEEMVRHLVDGFCYNRVVNGHVPCPKLI